MRSSNCGGGSAGKRSHTVNLPLDTAALNSPYQLIGFAISNNAEVAEPFTIRSHNRQIRIGHATGRNPIITDDARGIGFQFDTRLTVLRLDPVLSNEHSRAGPGSAENARRAVVAIDVIADDVAIIVRSLQGDRAGDGPTLDG